jgi:hypothetical protein
MALNEPVDLREAGGVPRAWEEFPNYAPHESGEGALKEDVIDILLCVTESTTTRARPLPALDKKTRGESLAGELPEEDPDLQGGSNLPYHRVVTHRRALAKPKVEGFGRETSRGFQRPCEFVMALRENDMVELAE